MESSCHLTHLLPLSPPHIPSNIHNMGCSRARKSSACWRYNYESVQQQAVCPVAHLTHSRLLVTYTSTLKRGQQRLYVHRWVEADPLPDTTTPSELVDEEQDEMGRLENLVKDYERGDVAKIDWLDRMAFRQIEKVHASEASKSDKLFLYVDLPKFDFPVVFSEQESPITLPPAPVLPPPSQAQMIHSALPPDLFSTDPHLWRHFDPDAWRDNPVEIKHRKLLRSQRLVDEGRDLKPGPADRDRLNVSPLLLLTFPAINVDGRKYSDYRPLPHYRQWTKICSGNSASHSSARRGL